MEGYVARIQNEFIFLTSALENYAMRKREFCILSNFSNTLANA